MLFTDKIPCRNVTTREFMCIGCNLTEDQRTTEPPEPAEPIISLFLTSELRACARASSRYDVANGTRSLARSIGQFL